MSKYIKDETPKKYCLYRQYKDNPNNQLVIEYFSTKEEAKQAAKKETRSRDYEVHIGVFE
jgi:hypothetical protein